MKRPTSDMLLDAYSRGIFPMAEEANDWEVYWYAPHRRAIIPIGGLNVSKSLARTMRKGVFEIRHDSAFTEVLDACHAPRDPFSGIWLSEGLRDAYLELHARGHAHSVEAWQDGELVGGLYGVTLGGLFAGESMFHRVTDASKVALVHLDHHLEQRGYVLHDCQFLTPHLARMGAIEVARESYEVRVALAMTIDATF